MVQLLVLMEALVHQKKSDINFGKAKTKFCLSLYYNRDNSYLFVNGKEIYKFKAFMEMLTCHLDFVLEVYLINLTMLIHKKYLLMEICIIFPLIMVLLINLTF